MSRPIIVFDYDKCTGCGVCVRGCGKRVLEMVDGKPVIVEDRLCDGLGVCIPMCRFGAITVENRDVPDFDPVALREYWAAKGLR